MLSFCLFLSPSPLSYLSDIPAISLAISKRPQIYKEEENAFVLK